MTIIGQSSMAFPVQEGDSVKVTVVLVKGFGPDLVAYAGVGTPAFVMHSGEKLTLREAEVHFPGIRSEMEKQKLAYRGRP